MSDEHCRRAGDKYGRRSTDTLIAQHEQRITALETGAIAKLSEHDSRFLQLEQAMSGHYDALSEKIDEAIPVNSKLDILKGIAYSLAMVAMAFIAGAEKIMEVIK